MRKRIEDWYRGRYVEPPPNDPNSAVVFMTLGHYEPHWTARVAQTLGRVQREQRVERILVGVRNGGQALLATHCGGDQRRSGGSRRLLRGQHQRDCQPQEGQNAQTARRAMFHGAPSYPAL